MHTTSKNFRTSLFAGVLAVVAIFANDPSAGRRNGGPVGTTVRV